MALGRDPDVAVNHDAKALAMHRANHPDTLHLQQDVWQVPPRWATKGAPVALLWASPDCTHFSRAKGAAPNRDEKRRDLAWVIVKWAEQVRPRVICLENVPEFVSWGPLDKKGAPVKSEAGTTFQAFVRRLRRLGYSVQWRELRARDYGAPTIRKRLFMVARCDGHAITWPEPTHGPGLIPYRTAAECIDWSIPCPSIFERKRPLADNTLKRIAEGIRRYVLEKEEPFIVNLSHGGRLEPLSEPLRTVTGAKRGEKALVTPFVSTPSHSKSTGRSKFVWAPQEPLRTITGGGGFSLVTPFLKAHYGTKGGKDLRVHGPEEPVRTVSTENRFGLVSAFLAKHYTGVIGSDLREPMGTVTSVDHHGLVYAFLSKYFGTSIGQDLKEPAHTVTGKHHFSLVTVTIQGQPYIIADIGMRMLQPRELYRAQGFRDNYIIDLEHEGRPLSKADQVRLCGNSVCPDVAAAIVKANVSVADLDSWPARISGPLHALCEA